MEKRLIVFIDSGDTLIDESTQVYDEKGIVLEAELYEGAKALLKALQREGYRVCLVADGEWDSFKNVYEGNGLRNCFEGWVVSEKVGVQKPERPMFDAAMTAMHLMDVDKQRIVMVGNNLKKDIAGANRYGLVSIWMDWSPRYFHEVEETDWTPDYTVKSPEALMPLLEKLNGQLNI
ncbi:HAD family hydrolase [Fusibacter sp. 3D3]|uniref:HAD family hydrolase n=1 Tax=Fusibacter sp. 3D3 TaxID=1048380 RepID=UPI000853A05D|nr:HAD family hydrolase [Fusibacter sp. 3D3]GAU76666.1 5'-nucleotidase YjjG [Fusibacter sp. 3D3]